MRKTIISLIMLTIAANMAAQDFLNNSEINRQWRQKTISVKNGGQTPDVVTLLRAFHQTLPAWVVGEVLKQADHPAKGTRQSGTASIWDGEEDDDYRILIDKKNGYVDLESETDINQMMACVWRKANGHRIFAVSLYEQHEMPQNLLCWYDYDPATQMMKPERSPLDDFKPVSPGATVTWDLPMKGTDFLIREYYPGLPSITHVYHWDKKQFQRGETQMPNFEYMPSVGDTHAEYARHSKHVWSHFALVDFVLFRQKIHREGLLQQRIALVLLIRKDAQNRALPPALLPSGRGDSHIIQHVAYADRRQAFHELPVDKAHDPGFLFVDHQVAILSPVITQEGAVGQGNLPV